MPISKALRFVQGTERLDAACPDLEGYGRAGSSGLRCGLVGDDGLAQTTPECGRDDSGCQEGWFCPVGRVDMKFTVGDTPGDYVTTITLYNGNSISMIVTAE